MRPPLPVLAPALLLVAGCSSPATRFLTLDAVAPASTPAAAASVPQVRVSAVRLPAALDRAEYVSEPSAGHAKISDFDHWIAPLGTLMHEILIRDLAARLPNGAVLPPSAPPNPAAVRIDVTVLSFDASSGTAVVQVLYQLTPCARCRWPAGRRQIELRAPLEGQDAGAAARAFSTILGQLSDRLAIEAGRF